MTESPWEPFEAFARPDLSNFDVVYPFADAVHESLKRQQGGCCTRLQLGNPAPGRPRTGLLVCDGEACLYGLLPPLRQLLGGKPLVEGEHGVDEGDEAVSQRVIPRSHASRFGTGRASARPTSRPAAPPKPASQ